MIKLASTGLYSFRSMKRAVALSSGFLAETQVKLYWPVAIATSYVTVVPSQTLAWRWTSQIPCWTWVVSPPPERCDTSSWAPQPAGHGARKPFLRLGSPWRCRWSWRRSTRTARSVLAWPRRSAEEPPTVDPDGAHRRRQCALGVQPLASGNFPAMRTLCYEHSRSRGERREHSTRVISFLLKKIIIYVLTDIFNFTFRSCPLTALIWMNLSMGSFWLLRLVILPARGL